MISMMHGKNGEKLYGPTFWFTDTTLGVKVKLSVLIDDGTKAPYKVNDEIIVAPGALATYGVSMYGQVCTELIQKIMSIDLTPPDKCECQSREWLEAHPGDKQEYWRTIDGRVYAKDHTNLCPKNPKNRNKHV